jgi:hypothetical protein
MATKLDWTRVKSDINGNPRYVVHFFALLTQEEINNYSLQGRYAIACARANSIGGRKFNNKQYGGGIVFQSYSLEHTEAAIDRVMERIKNAGN